MITSRQKRWAAAFSALVASTFGLASVLKAEPIPVNNFSFEEGVAGGWTNELPIDPPDDPDWIGALGPNDGGAFAETIGGFSHEGADHLGTQNGYYVFQNTGVAWQPNTRYELRVALGNRNDGNSPPGSISWFGLTVLDEDPDDFAALDGIDTNDQLIIDDFLSENAKDFETSDAWTPDGTFRDVTNEEMVVVETDDSPPTGNVVIFLGDDLTGGRSHFDNVLLDATPLDDTDSDNLLDAWELRFAADLTVLSGLDGADADSDTLTDLQEFEESANYPNIDPTKADTDEDGLDDKAEVDGPTDPTDADTDDDRLNDGDEANTHMTDPVDADSDDDGFEDFSEIDALNGGLGGDPNDTNVVPAVADEATTLVGINFIGQGRETVDPRPGTAVTAEAGFIPQENWNNFAGGAGVPDSSLAGEPTTGYNPLLDSEGSGTIMRITEWKTDGPDLSGFDEPAPGSGDDELMYGLLRPRGGGGDGVSTQVTISNIPYASYDVIVYADAETTGGIADYYLNFGEANEQAIFGVADFDSWVAGGNNQFVVADEGNNFEGNVVVFRGATGPTVNLLVERESVMESGGGLNGIQISVADDIEPDGMPDWWEEQNGLVVGVDDSQLDPDEDSLVNVDEFNRGTDPQDADTDDDTLLDGVETGTGTWVDVNDRGTSPTRKDSDGDGLDDNLEDNSGAVAGENAGTNPNIADTDEGGTNDGPEILVGTNPHNGADDTSVPIAYWSFDDGGPDGMTEDVIGTNDGSVNGLDTAFVDGYAGYDGDLAITFDGFESSVTTDLSLNGLAEITMMGWFKMDDFQENRTGLWGQNDANEFGLNGDVLGWWMPGPGQMDYTPLDEDYSEWTHLALVGNDLGRIIYINGEIALDDFTPYPIVNSSDLFNIGGDGIWDATGNFFFGEIDDVAVYDVAVDEAFVQAVAAREVDPLGRPVGGGPAEPTDLRFTNITVNGTAGTVDLTVAGVQTGANYSAEWSDNGGANWTEFEDFVGTADTQDLQQSGIDFGVTVTRIYRVRQQ